MEDYEKILMDAELILIVQDGRIKILKNRNNIQRGDLIKIMQAQKIKQRLEYLRGEIEHERISYGEIAELQALADHIEDDDVVLLEWAGVPEGSRG